MKTLLKIISLITLALILFAPFAYFFDQISFSLMTNVLLIATIVWFATSFFWIGRKDADSPEVEPVL